MKRYNFILQIKDTYLLCYGCPKNLNCLGNGKLDGRCLILEKEIFMDDSGLTSKEESYPQDYKKL